MADVGLLLGLSKGRQSTVAGLAPALIPREPVYFADEIYKIQSLAGR
jgi:hypothetical protein